MCNAILEIRASDRRSRALRSAEATLSLSSLSIHGALARCGLLRAGVRTSPARRSSVGRCRPSCQVPPLTGVWHTWHSERRCATGTRMALTWHWHSPNSSTAVPIVVQLTARCPVVPGTATQRPCVAVMQRPPAAFAPTVAKTRALLATCAGEFFRGKDSRGKWPLPLIRRALAAPLGALERDYGCPAGERVAQRRAFLLMRASSSGVSAANSSGWA